MPWLPSTLLSSAWMFAGTNLDDLVVLATLFAQPSLRPRHIVAGQYTGFTALVLLSVLGASGAKLFPTSWIGALGFIPIAMGLYGLVRALLKKGDDDSDPMPAPALETNPRRALGGLLHPSVFAIALITIANGGDNIGVYVPLFASADRATLTLTLFVFFTLVGLWCLMGHAFLRNPWITAKIQRSGHVVTPLVFIAVGVYILVDSGFVARAAP